MSQTITQPDNTRITLEKTAGYRDNYANSVQVRLSLWDFFLVFGTIAPAAQQADEVTIENFQGIYLSPQQAKALASVLAQNVAQYEQTFGPISLENTAPDAPRFVVPGKGPIH